MNYDYLSSASMSDVGQRRKNNQDAEIRLPDAGIFCVADGMGGGEAGEVASGKVVEAVKAFADQLDEAPGVDLLKYKVKYLSRTLDRVGNEIYHFAQDKGYQACGTTAVILVFDFNQPRRAGILHVGDSRLYRLRNGEFNQITIDHSAENEAGLRDRELPESMKHVITRAIGVHDHTQVEESITDVEIGDLFMICSDGLSGMVSDEAIKDILVKNIEEPPGHSVQDLVATANQHGGKDNITVTLVRVREFAGFHQEPGALAPYDIDEDDEDTADRPALSHRQPPTSKDETQKLGGTIPIAELTPNSAHAPRTPGVGGGPIQLDLPDEKPQKSLAFIWIPIFIALFGFLAYKAADEYQRRNDAKRHANEWISGGNTNSVLPHTNPDNPALQTPLEEFK